MEASVLLHATTYRKPAYFMETKTVERNQCSLDDLDMSANSVEQYDNSLSGTRILTQGSVLTSISHEYDVG